MYEGREGGQKKDNRNGVDELEKVQEMINVKGVSYLPT